MRFHWDATLLRLGTKRIPGSGRGFIQMFEMSFGASYAFWMTSDGETLTVIGVALDGEVAVEVEAVDVPEVTWEW